jgi:catechol 2,3-dioxygenase-like lactoylglutathione lyase family enzyme
MIKGLHHNAYRCRDSEETRIFYEDFLGLKLVSAFEIGDGMGLHTFFAMDDGSCLAFFEVPDRPFDFKRQDDRLCRRVDRQHRQRSGDDGPHALQAT